MDKLIIEGGRPLRGEVDVGGSKNAALCILLSTILAPGEHRVENVPLLRDVSTTTRLLESLGCAVRVEGATVCIDTAAARGTEAPYDLVRTMRASVLVLAPLLARFGRARVSLPGGCAIGARPIDMHLKGLTALGAEVELSHGYVEARAGRLRGARFHFDTPTVGGTEQLLMAAVTADGETVLENAAREPEILDLATALSGMGADIEGAGSDTLRVRGVQELRPGRHRVIPDRIETGTLMAAAAITGGDVRIRGARPAHLDAVAAKMAEAGVGIETEGEALRARAAGPIRPVVLSTSPHPGFPTDMQAQMMALLCLAEGASVITETIFENRFMHVLELLRLGADITVQGNAATVRGVPRLSGAPVMATDLRASASLVLAGLAGEGTTEVSRIYHLDRGYQRLEEKLVSLGARVERVPD